MNKLISLLSLTLWIIGGLLTDVLAYSDNNVVPQVSTVKDPVWFHIRVNDIWSTTDERIGRWYYNDGVGIATADKSIGESTLLTDAYLWRFDGVSLTSVKIVSKLKDNEIFVVDKSADSGIATLVNAGRGDTWGVDLTGSALQNARLLINKSNSDRYLNPRSAADLWSVCNFSGDKDGASSLFIYQVYNKYITVHSEVGGSAYIGDHKGTTVYDLIEGYTVKLHAVLDEGYDLEGWYKDGIKESDDIDYAVSAVGITKRTKPNYVAKFISAAPTTTPVFLGSNGGTYYIGQTIKAVVDAQMGSKVYYTTDGTTPTSTSSSVPAGGEILWTPSKSGTYNIKVRAKVKGKSLSEVVTSLSYIISGKSYSDICKPITNGLGNLPYLTAIGVIDATYVIGAPLFYTPSGGANNQKFHSEEIKAYPGAKFKIDLTLENMYWGSGAVYMVTNKGVSYY